MLMEIRKKILISSCLFTALSSSAVASASYVGLEAEKEYAITELNQTSKKTVKGIVRDDQGEPIPGASVLLENTTIGAATDIDGKFSFSIPAAGGSLVVKFMGMKTQKIKIGNKLDFDISLEPDVSSLDEVVVVAYGTSKKKDLTGAVTRMSANELKTAPMGASVQNMLQGRAAGVNVMISSASPTSPVSVVIRGASSLSGDNQPLWVVDGVPQYNNSTSGDVTNTLYNLNLNDVESIDILKDASATAIYGSRAANGVVIVTTKRGQEGIKPTIEVQARMGIQTMNSNDFSVLNKQQYIDFSKAAIKNQVMKVGNIDYFTKKYIDEKQFNAINTSQWDQQTFQDMFKDGIYYDGDTDWWKLMTQDAVTQEYNLSLQGGTKQNSYYASFFFKDQQGVVKGSFSESFGGRFNFESKVRESLKLGLNVDASARNTQNKDEMISTIVKMRPDYPAYNADGSINTIDFYIKNPLVELNDVKKNFGRSFSGTLFLEYDILKYLKFRTTGTINYVVSKTNTFKKVAYDGDVNSGSRKTNEDYIYVWENLLTFYKAFGKHDVQALLGQSIEMTQAEGLYAAGSNYPDDEVLTDLGSAAYKSAMSSPYSSASLASFFARLQYKFNERYLLTGTFRTDGSSRFGPDSRWGYFPSGAIAWILTEEDFMKDLKPAVSYLKLRASMGLSGSQNLGYYNWRTLMGSGDYNNAPGMIPSTLGNTNLQWESQTQIDAGLDYGFWDDRVRGSLGYYMKDVDNLIYNKPVPISSSFSSVSQNIGAIRNAGVEFDVKVDVLKSKNLNWEVNFNIAHNKGTLRKLNGTDKFFGGAARDLFKINEGDRLGQFFGYVDAGRLFQNQEEIIALRPINPETGKFDYYRDSFENAGDCYILDLDGDGKITDKDRKVIGNATPDFFGGFGSSLYWKGFMLNLTFTYSYGGVRYWQQESNTAGGINVYNTHNMVMGSWTMAPGTGKFPHVDYYGRGANGLFSNRFLHDASYLRLSSLNLSYRLPKRIFKKALIQGVDLNFQATNLFTITKYPGMDPQGNFSTSNAAFYGNGVDYSTYPAARTFNFSVKMTLQ